jgi:hypothetical protein
MEYIYEIVKKNKGPLILIYFYIFIAQLLFLAEPYVLGKAIDGLISKDYLWLLVFLGIEILANAFIYKRMLYDTKVFIKIYNQIVYEYLGSDKNSDLSSRIARTDIAHSIVNFLENDLHYYVMTSISIIGSLFFIFNQHSQTGFVVILCTIPMAFIAKKFYSLIAKSTKIGHDHYEQRVTAMESEDPAIIKTFYERRKRVLVHSSTIQGRNWASINTTKSIFLVTALIVFTDKNIGLTQGQAIAMYSYINQFLISLVSIPVGMEIYSRIKDVLNRIKTT